MAGPIPYPESPHPAPQPPQQPFPPANVPQGVPLPYPEQVPYAYPGTLPPPVVYPKRSRARFVLGALFVVVLVAAIVAAAVLIGRSGGDESAGPALTDGAATAAIQDYLDALSTADTEDIARHASCGLFDAVKDRKTDMALAALASDTFRRQFSSARVASIDKIVTWSPNQAQVLFTLRAVPAGRSQGEVERQAVAQILIEDPDALVCSFLPRNTGQY